MKIFLLALLLTAQAQALVLGYFRGEASPGRLVDSGGLGNDVTQTNDPGNPSTPTPPEGSLWFSGGSTDIGSFYVFSTSAMNVVVFAAGFTLEFWTQNLSSGISSLNQWYVDDAINYERVGIKNNSGTTELNVEDSVGGGIAFTAIGASDVSHHIRIEFAAYGGTCSIYSDCALVATFTRGTFTFITTSTVSLARSARAENYLDAYQISTLIGDTYLGPGACGGTAAVRTASPYRNQRLNRNLFISPWWNRP